MKYFYRGFHYLKNSGRGWTVYFPAGTKFQAPEQTEESLKASIDQLVDGGDE